MNIESLFTKENDYLKRKIKELNDTKTLLKDEGVDISVVDKEIDLYNDALEYKKIKKKMEILRNPEKFREIKYKQGDSLALRKNKVKRASKIYDELQNINRDFLRPLADKQDDPRGTLMWSDMEKNDQKVDEMDLIIENLKKKIIQAGSMKKKKTKKKKKSKRKSKNKTKNKKKKSYLPTSKFTYKRETKPVRKWTKANIKSKKKSSIKKKKKHL